MQRTLARSSSLPPTPCLLDPCFTRPPPDRRPITTNLLAAAGVCHPLNREQPPRRPDPPATPYSFSPVIHPRRVLAKHFDPLPPPSHCRNDSERERLVPRHSHAPWTTAMGIDHRGSRRGSLNLHEIFRFRAISRGCLSWSACEFSGGFSSYRRSFVTLKTLQCFLVHASDN